MSRLLVQDLMTDSVVTLKRGSSVAELLDLLAEREIRHVPIVDDDGELVGLVTDRDVLRGVLGDSQVDLPLDLRHQLRSALSVDTIMSTDVLCIAADQTVAEAAGIMLENKIGCVPVTEGPRLVGILTESDVARWVAENT